MTSSVFRTTVPRVVPLGRVRRADLNDVPHIMNILNVPSKKTFRCETSGDLICLIKYAVIAIVQLDIGENIVGVLIVKDFPNIPAVHPAAWENFIWSRYKAVELRSRNTLFIHLLCWLPEFARDGVDNMLRSIFMHDAYVNFIAMVKALPEYPLLIPGQSRAEASFRRMTAMERGVPGDRLPVLCVAERKEVCPRLRIRRAVEEDNDDIVPIIEKQSTRLKEIYGEFYISELISRHPESDRVLLVCEHNEEAVGVMCLNTQINYESLQKNYELSIYAGLRHIEKPAPSTKPSKLLAESTASILDLFSPDMVNFDNAHAMKEKFIETSKVSWADTEEDAPLITLVDGNTNKADDEVDLETNTQRKFTYLELLEDEEEIEFDIINIDTDLLRVPQLLSYDDLARRVSNSFSQVFQAKQNESVDDSETKHAQEKPKKIAAVNKSSLTNMNDPIDFLGPPNAFIIELFALKEGYDGRYGFDMLEAAYDIFPDRDYCILSLPTSHAAFPLLEHFTTVSQCSYKTKYIKKTLYIAHYNSVRGNLSVRPGEPCDYDKIKDVTEHIPKRVTVLEQFETSLHSPAIKSYVLLSEQLPVGLVLIGPLKEGGNIRTFYSLKPNPQRPKSDGAILNGVISPAFEPHARWYLREVMRQSEFTSLLWICRLIARGESHPKNNMMSLAGHMVPIRSRPPLPTFFAKKTFENIHKQSPTPYSLWYIDRHLSSFPKVDVNHSIVIVGASTTGLAFIEALISGSSSSYLTLGHITLVSEHGIPSVSECLKAADMCVPHRGRLTDRYIKTVPFYFYIDVLVGVLIKIDRENKCIYLKNGGIKFYDDLFITCGQQFQHPDYLRESLNIEKELQKGKPCQRILMDNPKYRPDQVPLLPELPENVMIINSIFDANQCLRRLLRMISDGKDQNPPSSKCRVVVYGDCLEAYSCISALLELGLTADKIAFVEPYPSEDATELRVNCFNNETVDERVQDALEEMGIKVYRRSHLFNWRTGICGKVQFLRVISTYHITVIPCFALFYYGLKAIDINAFKAINECGLVYDGCLVIGPEFQTNDPNIFAAGTCTKYSRRLYADSSAHKYFSSEDIGLMLANFQLRRLDPFLIASKNLLPDILPHYSSSSLQSTLEIKEYEEEKKSDSRKISRRWRPVIRCEMPLMVWCTLPGPLHYFKIRSPGRELPEAVACTMPRQGHTLITDHRGNYFCLQLDILHTVRSITCLSKDNFQADIFVQLYGKHEHYFNNLLKRYKMNLIDDLFKYFIQPWMSATMMELFNPVLDDIREHDVGTIYDIAKSYLHLGDALDFNIESMVSSIPSCVTIPSYGVELQVAEKLGSFRDVVEEYITKAQSEGTFQFNENDKEKIVDVPSECGGNTTMRAEAAAFWHAVKGERIVLAHLARYLKETDLLTCAYAATQS